MKGTCEEIKGILMAIPEIVEIEEKEEGKEGFVNISITAMENADVREVVFYALAEAKLPIMSMQYLEKSLEDIFLELTEEV